MGKIYRALAFVLFICFGSALFSQVVINEYCASNKGNYSSGGKYYDWVELFNTTGASVNIGGWYISDTKNNPTKYQVPAGVTVPANGFRIFLCSNLNVFSGGQYHTNFKIQQSDTSEEILLTSSLLVRMDSVKVFPCDSNDSRGRTTNGANAWSVFTKATPNASNNSQTAYLNYVPKPQLNIPAGFYTSTQSVALSCVQPNTTIRYTTDGSTPSITSTIYSSPISVTATKVIRARAFDNTGQYAPSFTETNTYFINETHTLPVVSVCGKSLSAQLANGSLNKQFGSLEFFNTNSQQEFEIGGEFSPHGNDSWAYSQRGFDFNIEDEYGTGDHIKEKMFYTSPRKKFQWLIFKAGASDNFPDGGSNPPNRCAHIRDAYDQTLAEKFNLNLDLRRMDHCIVFVNGQYWGVYEYREKVDADYFDYYYDQQEKDVDDLTYWGGLNVRYGSDTAWTNLYNFIISNSMTVPANYQHVADRLDVMSLIDDIALGIYTVNSDWLNWNTAWWRGRKGPNNVKWKYWLWDTDNIFNLGENYTGWSSTNYTANPCDLSGLGGGTNYNNPNIGADQGHIVIFNRLMDNPTFKSLYISRLGTLLNTAFNCTNMLNHLDTMVARIQPEMQRHCTKWGGSYTQWLQNVQYLRNQINGRCAVFSGGVDSCYNVTGPYPVTINISPSCAGTVTIGTVETPQNYPYTGTYFGGVNQNFVAHPATGWQFDHWIVISHTPQPSTTADSIWFDLGTSGDSLVAFFTQVNPTPGQLTVILKGNNPGLVTVNGTPVSSGQVVSNISYGSSVDVTATPIAGCTFYKWELNHTLVYPVDTLETGSFCFRQNDTLVAIFDNCNVVPDSLTVLIQQSGFGTVTINSINVPAPITIPMNSGTALNIAATPNTGYTFSAWQMFHHSLTPNNTSPNATFTFTQRDTLIAIFTAPDTFDLTVMVNPIGGGNVDVNSNTLSAYPTVLQIVDGTMVNIAALANVGYSFANWTVLHHTLAPGNTSVNANFVITQSDTIVANFTLNPNLPDTFDLTVMVNPVGGGNVDVNGTTPSAYPTVLQIVDGTMVNIAALANVGYSFANWTVLHHTLAPGNTSANANFVITQSDTLVANFTLNPNPPDTFNLRININLPGSGNVTVNSNALATYPTILQIVDGTLVNISATPNGGYVFDTWSLNKHTLNPNNTTANASFVITDHDTLTANFKTTQTNDTFNVVLQAFPANGGSININGTSYSSFPTDLSIPDQTLVNATATANAGFAFTQWHVVFQSALPNDGANPMHFTVAGTDTIYAFFTNVPDTFDLTVLTNPAGAGDVSINGNMLTAYPSIFQFPQGTSVSALVTANTGFTFTDWSIQHHSLAPSTTDPNVNFTFNQRDTLVANFYTWPDTLGILVDISPNVLAGDVQVGGFTPPSYPWMVEAQVGSNLDFQATAHLVDYNGQKHLYVFDHYDFIHHQPIPNNNDPIVFITVQQADTVIAYFRNVPYDPDTFSHILLPTAFSPDNDGVNDVFHLIGEHLQEYYMAIYNRWGQKVFESDNQGYGWNGSFKDKPCDIGVYVYLLKGKRQNGEDVFLKGTVTLFR